MTRILFDSRNWWCDLQSDLHRFFDTNPHLDIKCLSVFHNYKEAKKYPDIDKIILTTYWESCRNEYNEESLIKIEEKYDTVNLWNVIYSDRFLNGDVHLVDQKEIVQYVSFYFSAWEKIVKEFKPDFIVSETITGLWNYALYSVAKAQNIVYLGLLPAKNSNKFYYSRDLMGRFLEFEKKYNDMVNRDLARNQLDEVQTFLRTFIEERQQPAYMSKVTQTESYWEIFNPYRVSRSIFAAIKFNLNPLNRFDHISIRQPFEFSKKIKKKLRRDIAWKLQYFDDVPSGENYILFPLHFQPEVSTDFWARYYRDQLYVIKQLARSIPFGYKLYVKEHSANYGTKSLSFYRQIRSLPNVRLLSPFQDIYQLIENASVVSVITSTTGLEAIFFNKPVVIFGSSLFDFYPHLFKVENINDLPKIINQAIDQRVSPDDVTRLKFIYTYINSGYEGNYFKLQKNTSEEIRLFAKNLCSEMGLTFNI